MTTEVTEENTSGDVMEQTDSGRQPEVGTRITNPDALRTLPTGTVIRSNTGRTYTRVMNGYRTVGGRVRTLATVQSWMTELGRTYEVIEVTFTGTPDDSMTRGSTETLDQFKQRFRTVVLGACQRSGVSMVPVKEALRELGVEKIDPAPGVEVSVHDARFLQKFPEGTLFSVGDPAEYGHFAAYRLSSGGGLLRILGGRGQGSHEVVKAVTLPDGTERPGWVDETDLDGSQSEAIKQFMRRAWQVGARAKTENSYCGEYENAMSAVGITEASIREASAITAEQAAELPEGTLLRWVLGEEVVWYRRDDSSVNPAKTVRVFGTVGGSWAASNLEVVVTPEQLAQSLGHNEGVYVRIASIRELDAMPIGSLIAERRFKGYPRDVENFRFVKTRESDPRPWEYRGGGQMYASRDFGITAYTIYRIGAEQ